MKKILSVVLSCMLVLSLGVGTAAAKESPSVEEGVELEVISLNGSNELVPVDKDTIVDATDVPATDSLPCDEEPIMPLAINHDYAGVASVELYPLLFCSDDSSVYAYPRGYRTSWSEHYQAQSASMHVTRAQAIALANEALNYAKSNSASSSSWEFFGWSAIPTFALQAKYPLYIELTPELNSEAIGETTKTNISLQSSLFTPAPVNIHAPIDTGFRYYFGYHGAFYRRHPNGSGSGGSMLSGSVIMNYDL